MERWKSWQRETIMLVMTGPEWSTPPIRSGWPTMRSSDEPEGKPPIISMFIFIKHSPSIPLPSLFYSSIPCHLMLVLAPVWLFAGVPYPLQLPPICWHGDDTDERLPYAEGLFYTFCGCYHTIHLVAATYCTCIHNTMWRRRVSILRTSLRTVSLYYTALCIWTYTWWALNGMCAHLLHTYTCTGVDLLYYMHTPFPQYVLLGGLAVFVLLHREWPLLPSHRHTCTILDNAHLI